MGPVRYKPTVPSVEYGIKCRQDGTDKLIKINGPGEI